METSFSTDESAVPDTGQQQLERRRSERLRVLGTAKLLFGFNKTVLDCVTVDQSREGLRVYTESLHVLPEELWVQFPFGRPIYAKIRWSSCSEAGLELFPEEGVVIRRAGSPL